MGNAPLASAWRGSKQRVGSSAIWLQRVLQTHLGGLRKRYAAKLLIDCALILAAGAWTWFVFFGQAPAPGSLVAFLAAIGAVRLPIYSALGLHRHSWSTVSRFDIWRLVASALLAPPVLGLLFFYWPAAFGLERLLHPSLVLVTEPALYLTLLGGARICVRAVAATHPLGESARRVLVIGAGSAARALVWQIRETETDYQVVGLIDDNCQLHGTHVLGLPVLGGVADVVALVPAHTVQQILVAIPSLTPERLREVLATCEQTGVPVRILPPLRELIQNGAGVSALREVRMEDLLPRAEVKLDEEQIASYLDGRTVLITGGGGSIGSELCRQVRRFGAARLLVLGRGENSVFEIVQELAEAPDACEVMPVICDIQDRASLRQVFATYRPDVVFHAAAHKHVPLMERYPAEAVRNNVLGTLNVIELSAEFQVSRFVLVSTDKAVDPSSVMGSTKRVAEKLVKGFALARDMNMVSVRFGNVLGSRGSVIPLMTRQISRGQPVTITDPEMWRYFMTIPEACQLILQAGAIGGRGEIFVLDMGRPVRIIDLACDLIRLCGLVPHQDVPIKIVGRRPGEKLREVVLNHDEAEAARKNGQFYIAPPEPVHLVHLLGQVKRLHRAATASDREQIMRILQEIVPAYVPDTKEESGRPAAESAEAIITGRAA